MVLWELFIEHFIVTGTWFTISMYHKPLFTFCVVVFLLTAGRRFRREFSDKAEKWVVIWVCTEALAANPDKTTDSPQSTVNHSQAKVEGGGQHSWGCEAQQASQGSCT